MSELEDSSPLDRRDNNNRKWDVYVRGRRLLKISLHNVRLRELVKLGKTHHLHDMTGDIVCLVGFF
jgi:hypothetical protein